METNKKDVAFPIDNKNVMEDFTEAIHDDECIEYRFECNEKYGNFGMKLLMNNGE